ncbi:hypothetical protein [Methylocella sp.]|jgi:hypothetical protein|uniref:hypothetical protein n=1 Tax=Methylocella sp. TaxID=1978226 RepID=UPI003C29DF6F
MSVFKLEANGVRVIEGVVRIVDDRFRYSDKEWGAIADVVDRAVAMAGAPATDDDKKREKIDAARAGFRANRLRFERFAAGWKQRIADWNGVNFGRDDRAHAAEIADLAGRLAEVLGPFGVGRNAVERSFPFFGDDAESPIEGLNRFRDEVRLLHDRAARLAAGPQKRHGAEMRDRFFIDLLGIWRGPLGLGGNSCARGTLANRIVETVCAGVYHFPTTRGAPKIIETVAKKYPENRQSRICRRSPANSALQLSLSITH